MALFDKSYDKVPDLLKGRILHANAKKFTILEAQGYAKTENDKGGYKPIVTMQPGAVYCPSVQGHVMTLIACRDGMQYGGCVLLRQVLSSTGGVFDKASKVTAALGINAQKTVGEILERPDGDLELRLTTNPGAGKPVPEVKPAPVKQHKITMETLKRLAPSINEAWMRKEGKTSLHDFIKHLTQTCEDEASLLKALK